MFRVVAALFPLCFLLSGCGPWFPVIISTGVGGLQLYRGEVLQGAYEIPMEDAYEAAIGTTMSLGLEVTSVNVGDKRRVIKSKDAESQFEITIDLKQLSDAKYIKATFWAVKHHLISDKAYSMAVMKEFSSRLHVKERIAHNEQNQGDR